MREIKFRAWDGEKIHPDVIRTLSYCLIAEDITVEQYTGIKDRNGVEIFENDIVQMGYTAGHHEQWDMNTFAKTEDYNEVDTYVLGVVRIWASKGVVLVNLVPDDPEQFNDEHKIPAFINVTRYCSVVGNIHENPELLEEQS